MCASRPLALAAVVSSVLSRQNVGEVHGGTALGLLVTDHFVRLINIAVVLAAATMVVALLRWRSVLAPPTLLGAPQAQAFTDALTALGNRRRLLVDLDHELRRDRQVGPDPRPSLLFSQYRATPPLPRRRP